MLQRKPEPKSWQHKLSEPTLCCRARIGPCGVQALRTVLPIKATGLRRASGQCVIQHHNGVLHFERQADRRARVRADSFAEQKAMPLSKTKRMDQTKCSDRFPQGGPDIGIGDKRSAPIGVGGREIGTSRKMGAMIIRRDGITPPMIGADTRLRLLLDVDIDTSLRKPSVAFALRAGVRRSKPLPAVL